MRSRYLIKKYNSSTGGYKINIFVNGVYACSTDWCKTCKAAKNRYIQTHSKNLKPSDSVTANFCKS